MTFIVQSLDTLLRYVLSVTFRGAVVLKIMDQKTLVSLLFFLFVNFSPALYYLNAWNRLKILPLVKLFSDLRAPSSTPSNFHSLICLMSLLGVQRNYSGVTNRPLQAKKVVSKGKKRR